MDIPNPPDRPICAAHGPLKWGWFADTKQGARWVSFTIGEGGVLAPHVCDNPGSPAPRWQPDEAIAARAHEHADLIRERFGWPKRTITEGGVRHA
jgi:hypothetical protein